jgi:polyhydroxyalkanoate synthesis regulator phasin
MGKAKSRKIRDLMRKVEYERKQVLEEKNQATIDFLKTYSKIAQQTEDYPLTEKVLDLKHIASIDPVNYPDGLVLPDSWVFEFGLK